MLQFAIIPTSELTDHATDAIKTVVHIVNMKFRKLKKINVRNTNKTRQLKQEVLELSSMAFTQYRLLNTWKFGCSFSPL